ncbi:MAG: RNase P subunit p30 family protein [Candidatus Aenigmatarchaeota archaeon]
MKVYDLYLKPEFSEGKSELEDFAHRARILGYSGICVFQNFERHKEILELREEFQRIEEKSRINVLLGFEASNTKELVKLSDIRREYDVLAVIGGNINLNRKAVETPEVDILVHPEKNRVDSGFNHIMARLASKNNVAMCVDFREILITSKNTRAHILSKIMENIKICKKYGVKIIISSGAFSHLQMKDPKVLISMGVVLGLRLDEAKKCLSENPESIINFIKERQDKNWVRPGVRVV